MILGNLQLYDAQIKVVFKCLHISGSPVKSWNKSGSPNKYQQKPTCPGKLIKINGQHECDNDSNHVFAQGNTKHVIITVNIFISFVSLMSFCYTTTTTLKLMFILYVYTQLQTTVQGNWNNKQVSLVLFSNILLSF